MTLFDAISGTHIAVAVAMFLAAFTGGATFAYVRAKRRGRGPLWRCLAAMATGYASMFAAGFAGFVAFGIWVGVTGEW